MCKILELYGKNPWRNNLSKLATLDSIFQLNHSAMDLIRVSMMHISAMKLKFLGVGWNVDTESVLLTLLNEKI